MIYFLSIYFLPKLINIGILDKSFMIRLGIITMASWLPLHILKLIIQCYAPSDYVKIMKKR